MTLMAFDNSTIERVPDSISQTDRSLVRLIAFYLPQFFPIPENDEWWGPGFTEWTNVANAKTYYRGHWQPHFPAELGYYDLRLERTRERQADLAREAGVSGFCFWHYWFGGGRRILHRQFDEMLATGKPDFPFCLAWANQSWTGIWHGSPNTVLVEQTYPSDDDFKDHFNLVLPAFRDNRYLCVDGKPIFVIYDPANLHQTNNFVALWRKWALEAGLPGVFFIGMSNRYDPEILAPFDMLMEFGPGNFIDRAPRDPAGRLQRRLQRRDFGAAFKKLSRSRFEQPTRFEYKQYVDAMETMTYPDERYAPAVLSNWDNTPRSGTRGVAFDNPTPALFQRHLEDAIRKIKARNGDERIVFIKAWNEWAEGNYLEPDTRYGHAYLTATRQALAAAG